MKTTEPTRSKKRLVGVDCCGIDSITVTAPFKWP